MYVWYNKLFVHGSKQTAKLIPPLVSRQYKPQQWLESVQDQFQVKTQHMTVKYAQETFNGNKVAIIELLFIFTVYHVDIVMKLPMYGSRFFPVMVCKMSTNNSLCVNYTNLYNRVFHIPKL